jgi:hypothetical protein
MRRADWHNRQPFPILIRPVPRQSLGTLSRNVQIQDGRIAVVMKEPRVHEEALRCDREIMAAFHFTNARRGVVIVPIPVNFASKPVSDETGASCAMARLMFTARK